MSRVTPGQEPHVPSPDCWCEPKISAHRWPTHVERVVLHTDGSTMGTTGTEEWRQRGFSDDDT